MRSARRAVVVAAVLAGWLAGCAIAPAEAPPAVSLLDQVPDTVPRRAASSTPLIVFAPEARPSIDTTQMAYTLGAHQLAYFAHNQWAESPPQMLQPLLVRTLEATGAFAAVVPPPHRQIEEAEESQQSADDGHPAIGKHHRPAIDRLRLVQAGKGWSHFHHADQHDDADGITDEPRSPDARRIRLLPQCGLFGPRALQRVRHRPLLTAMFAQPAG